MTPKIIELKQAPVVLVELPPDVYSLKYGDGGLWVKFDDDQKFTPWYSCNGNINLLGTLSDLTEEQFAECVAKVNFESGPVYKNYKTFKGLGKASESFDTLLELEKVHTKGNPLDKTAKSVGHGTLDNFDQDYEEAQKRTVDPSRTVVLLRKEDV